MASEMTTAEMVKWLRDNEYPECGKTPLPTGWRR